MPNAPALEIAATNSGPEICIIQPPMIGYWMPNKSVIRVLNIVDHLSCFVDNGEPR